MLSKSARSTILLIGQTYSVVLLGLIVGILSARSLSVNDRGILALILLITQLISRLGSLGLEQSIHKYGLPEEKILQTYYAGMLGVLLCSPIFLFTIPHEYLTLTAYLVITSFFIHILRVNLALFVFNEDLTRLSIVNLFQSISQIILYACAFNYRSLGLFLWLWILNVSMFSILSVWLTNKNSKIFLETRFSLRDILIIWKRGWNFNSIAIPEVALLFCLELPIIRSVLGGTQAGLYSISNTITNIYYQVFAAISAVYSKQNDKMKLGNLLIILLILGLSVIFFAGDAISIVFGNRYRDSNKYVAIMLPATFLLGWVRLEQIRRMNKIKEWQQLTASILLVLMIMFSYLLDSKTVVYGIAASYSLYSLIIFSLLRSGFTRRKYNMRGIE